jgi:hypothetical protein
MFFFPVGSSPEAIENYFKIVNKNKNKNKKTEEIKDKTRMTELKTEMHKFLNKKHTSISTSGMMYYSYLYIEYSKLAKKYNDWELL